MSTKVETITVSNIVIDVVKKDIKNLHLGVYPPTGRVRIAAPLQTTNETIRLFAISKLGWIKRHQHNFITQERESKKEYVSGESHYFMGKRYLLQIIEDNSVSKVVVRHKKLFLYIKPGSNTKQKATLLNNWLRKQMRAEIPTIIMKWESKLNVKLSSWGIKRMKTKWGTCNIEAKRIWLNLELAKKPLKCIEYIVIHEMIHLLERHHNENFTAYLDKFFPQWKSCKKELNELPVSYSN